MKSLEILWYELLHYELLQCDLPVHLFLYYLKESIRSFRIKDFIAGHNRNQIFGMGQINNIMSPSGNHVDSFDPISTYLKFHNSLPVLIFLSWIRPCPCTTINCSHLELCQCCPLVIPGLLILMETWPRSWSLYQLSKRTSVITVHFHGIFKPVCRQIGKIQGKKLLRKRTCRHFRHHQIYRLLLKLHQQIHNLT